MPLILLTEPTEEPVTLADAKLFLRVEHGDEDALIGSLIRAARMQVEAACGQRLVTQLWRLVLDEWPGGTIRLPLAPVQAVEAARLRDRSGVSTSLDTAGWVLSGASPVRLRVDNRPAPLRPFAGIEIDVRAGFGAAGLVPDLYKQAVRLLVAHWYEQRGGEPERGSMPGAVHALLGAERPVRL